MNNLTKRVLKEINYTFKIEFSAQDIKEEVLAITFIELGYLVLQFVKHWETLRCVTLAWNH